MPDSIAHYEVIRKLGSGGMGEVYLAHDRRLDRDVALKLLSLEGELSEAGRERFLQEARSASALNHPNVCIIHEIGETKEGQLYIAMEFVEGTNLRTRVAEGPLPIREVVDIAAQVADALDAAHSRGVIHRDIKSENICLGERGRVKVLDFGLAKKVDQDAGGKADLALTQSGTILGTPAYMSPEQVLAKPVDHRTDVFSLGVVLYELLTCRLPFQGDSLAEVADRVVRGQPEAIARFNYEVPADLERIVRKCLEKDRERRYQSARELYLDLDSLRRELAEGVVSPPFDSAGATLIVEEAGSGGASQTADSVPETTDVVISYSPVDDRPLSSGRAGWVSQFQRLLEVRLSQLSGERLNVWRPAKQDSAVADSRLLERVPEARTLVTVVSPPFVRSEACHSEVRAFLDGRKSRGGVRVADRSRLVKVVKTPVPEPELGDLAPVFQDLLGYDFFEQDPTTGRIREFDEIFGEEARQRYFERIYDLAYEINQVLRLESAPADSSATDDRAAESNGTKGRVYLALTTSDLQAEYDSVRRELLEQGYLVVPDKPLPMVYELLEQAVHEYLADCELVIQLIGGNYGLVPENARQSVLELQAEWTATRVREQGGRRFVWLPGEIDAHDDRQSAFIRRLREKDAADPSTELIEGSLTLFKDLLKRSIQRAEEEKKTRAESPTASAAEAPPQVYVICDAGDEAAVEPLEDYLFAQGLEVCLPDFSADQEQVGEVHRENLRDCDAVLIFYGTARKAWVDIKLRDLLKANGYGRSKPLTAKAVYIAPPEDRRKERFKSHLADAVIRQSEAGFEPTAELGAFIASVKAGP